MTGLQNMQTNINNVPFISVYKKTNYDKHISLWRCSRFIIQEIWIALNIAYNDVIHHGEAAPEHCIIDKVVK